jgi:hypothetical protein
MAQLNFNVLGFIYQDGIRNLRKMWDAASEGLNRHLQAAYDEVELYDRSVKTGTPAQIECDDETGQVIYDHRDTLIYHTTTAEEAKSTLNKSIVITAFHHWERSARDWTRMPQNKNFFELRTAVTAKGYPVSNDLVILYLLANLLKHANPKHGAVLYEKRRDFFRRDFDPSHARIEWFEEIDLSDDQVTEIFDTLAACGPTAESIFTDQSA